MNYFDDLVELLERYNQDFMISVDKNTKEKYINLYENFSIVGEIRVYGDYDFKLIDKETNSYIMLNLNEIENILKEMEN